MSTKNYTSIIKKLLSGNSLDKETTHAMMEVLLNISPIQRSCILSLLSAKKESVEEILGIRNYLYKHTDVISENDIATDTNNMLDIVGTGGDGIGTFNISTASSIVIASSGVKVVKHGNKSITGKVGSSNVISTLKIQIPQTKKEVIENINKNNFTYISAPIFNSMMKELASLRKEMGFPTIFNIVGPICNPLSIKPNAVIGVFRKDLVEKTAICLREIGVKRALVVHSDDGLDEISISASTKICELHNNIITNYEISPEDVGLNKHSIKDILAESSDHSANIINDILSCKQNGAPLDIILFNSGAGLYISGKTNSIREGVALAKELITSKKTFNYFNQLKTNINGGSNV